jgi:DNA invertase Pin-like site-specific DNA recombinase
MPPNMKPLIPYLRQSRRKEVTISIEEQRRDIERWAKANDVALAPEVVEQGVSGSKSWRERGLGEAVAACERREAQGIVVAWQDRLSRENGLATAEVWDALQRVNARLVCAAEGLDTATGDHEMLFSIKAAVAREQWKRHRSNWARATRNAIERGVHIGSAPAGYSVGADGKLVENEHAVAVRQAFQVRADGGSWTQVAAVLTEAAVPTSRGATRWSLKAAEKALRNEAYLGIVRYGNERNVGAHEPLVERSLFEAVQARREKRERAVVRGVSEGRLLSGQLRCATCGHRLTLDFMMRNGLKYPFYRCRNAGACEARPSIGAERVEQYVKVAMLAWLGGVEYDRTHEGGDALQMQMAVEDSEVEIAAYVQHTPASTPGYADGLALRTAVRDAAVGALANSVSYTETIYLTAAETAEGYERMQVTRQRQIVAALIDRITVKTGRGAVPERVAITFTPHPYSPAEPINLAEAYAAWEAEQVAVA